MREEYFLIVNPVAGRKRSAKIFPRLQAELKKRGISFEHRMTSAPKEATAIAKEAVKSGFNKIVAVGGDGTVNEVANGVIGTEAVLGIIPTGSGNDVVKSLGIPTDPFKALSFLKSPKRRKIDVGKIENMYFVNGLGIGLDGAVAQASKKVKFLRGETAYLYAALKEAFTFKSFPLEIRAPQWSYQGQVLLTGASNGQYYGGDFRLAPAALVDDGLFDVYIIEDFPLWQRLKHIPKVRTGAHLKLSGVHMKQAPWVYIKSSEPLIAHMDGEFVEVNHKGFRVEIIKGGLEIIN